MKLKDKKFPKMEVPASFERYAEGGYLMDQRVAGEEDVYAAHVPMIGSAAVTTEVSIATTVGDATAAPTTAAPTTPTATAAATPTPPTPEQNFEACVDAVITCIGSQNSLREILYKTLVFCEETHEFSEVEKFISTSDEFVYSHIIQTPYTMIDMLVRAGGLNKTPLDGEGSAITSEQLASLNEDEADALIAGFELYTSKAGKAAVELLSPERRIEAQLAQKSHRKDTYMALLDFCKEPRTFPEIEEFFKTTPGLSRDVVAGHHQIAPDFYVDKLDKAGALVWRGAWVATDAGRRIAASC